MASTPAPRAPRADVRERVLAAAEEVFTSEGYAAASLATIARRAGFTKGAVYSNFASKNELFTELLVQRSRWRTEAALAELTGGVVGASRDGFVAAAGRVLAHAVLGERDWLVLVTELAVAGRRDADARATSQEFRRRQRDALAAALRERLAEWGIEGVDPDRAARLLQLLITGIVIDTLESTESTESTGSTGSTDGPQAPPGLEERVAADCALVIGALVDESAQVRS